MIGAGLVDQSVNVDPPASAAGPAETGEAVTAVTEIGKGANLIGLRTPVTPFPVRAHACYKRRMCNLYSVTTNVEAMRRLFAVARGRDRLGNLPPLPSVYPRGEAPVCRLGEDGARELVRMHWGFLMPQASKKTGEPILPKAINNTRDDKVRTSGFWRSSFESRRCLIPATSFCEPKGRAPATYFWFALAGDEERPPFAFAGIWRAFKGWYREEMVELDTCSIITTTPNELVRPIHPARMPVILAEEDHETWLAGAADDAAELMRPFAADRMRIVRSGEDEKSDPAPLLAA